MNWLPGAVGESCVSRVQRPLALGTDHPQNLARGEPRPPERGAVAAHPTDDRDQRVHTIVLTRLVSDTSRFAEGLHDAGIDAAETLTRGRVMG